MRVQVKTNCQTRHNNYPYPCVGADIAMTQPGTPVQAHPRNPTATPPTTSTLGHEQPRPACSHTAPTAGLKTDTELPPMDSVVITVQGATFDLPTPDADVLDRAEYMATEYSNLLTRTPSAPADPVELRATLQRLTAQFPLVEAERIALADAAGFFISDEQLKRDITHWQKAGTLETVIEDHHARHREMVLMKNAQLDTSQTIRGLILCAKSSPKAAISTPRLISCAQGELPHSGTCKPVCCRFTIKPSQKCMINTRFYYSSCPT